MVTIKNTLKNNYTKIATEAIIDKKISTGAFKLYVYLLSNEYGTNTSAEEIAKTFKVNKSTIYRWLTQLEKADYIIQESKYTIVKKG